MSQENEAGPERMRPECDVRGGARGKYLGRYREGTNLVLLDRDVAAVFHDSESVNRALRLLIDIAAGRDIAT